jgi:hypothetical protein
MNIRNFNINNRRNSGCNLLISVLGINDIIVNFIATPNTYFVNHVMLREGDCVICFYDPNANRGNSRNRQTVIPPRFEAVVIAVETRYENIIVDFFNRNLINQRRTVQLLLSTDTVIVLTNGQEFIGNLGNRVLVVIYQDTSRGRFTQITPTQVVVLC